jgi:predicted 3-demethylubiquinone-9 3-methyltransferase (glyoxalase superfamily)
MTHVARNTICIWYDHEAEDAARFYASVFPDSEVMAVHRSPMDNPGNKAGDVLVVHFTVCGIPCIGLNGGPLFPHTEAFSFQIATDTQEETDRYWNAIVGNGGRESECGRRSSASRIRGDDDDAQDRRCRNRRRAAGVRWWRAAQRGAEADVIFQA